MDKTTQPVTTQPTQPVTTQPTQPVTKISQLRKLMEAGEWREAISLAAKFPRLGCLRNAILDAQTAYTNPGFLRQLRRDPDAAIKCGIAALQDAYGE